jgi:hypothetical protein
MDRINRVEALEEALIAAIEFIDRYADIDDGPGGIPVPNAAMSLNTYLQEVLDGKHEQ